MVIVPDKKQVIWGWPAVVNFTLGGAAAGLYLVVSFMTIFPEEYSKISSFQSFYLSVPLLICLGLTALTFEVGRPSRTLFVVRHFGRSWMSNESIVGGLFVLLVIVDCFYRTGGIRLLASIAALLFLICQGKILSNSRAISAWNRPMVPIHFVLSGAYLGYGFFVIILAVNNIELGTAGAAVGIACIIINLLVWLIYYRLVKESTIHNFRPKVFIFSIVAGYVFPFVMLFSCWMSLAFACAGQSVLLTGVAIIANGWGQKKTILCSAGFFRAIAF